MHCHRLPERSFHFRGKQFPVCARCTGIYLGELIMLILLFIGFRLSIFWSLICILPFIIDGTIQYFNLIESTNMRRFITGLIGGFGIIGIYFYIIKIILSFIY